ncbi:glycosyltransferase [Microbacterium panaciterrae]|uniref:D-inositol 3-phosphate glycosyltransferase n=1 Tax=Microbacterium panaciterrae TaxID=985759 RepID=A0ABP8PH31_9MICO
MRLLYVSPGPLDAKAVDGLSQFAVTWPGDVVTVAPAGANAAPAETPAVRVITEQPSADTVRALSPDVVLALHRPEFAWLTAIAPTVYTAEFTRRIRTDQQHLTAHTGLDRARISVGQLRRERQYRAMASSAAGLQCNGLAAWDAYARLSPSPLAFRDHRIRAADLALARTRDTWDGRRPLRVAFSGRITAVKGPRTVLDVAALMPEVEFVVLGDGDQRAELQRRAPGNVRFAGFLAFAEWTAYVREHVDLALLPYPQGDPSGTYYEALGSGVPVVGARNTTWRRLADDEGLGWAEPDAPTIAERIRTLRPADLDAVRTRALDALVPFEEVAAQRVAHLATIAAGGR